MKNTDGNKLTFEDYLIDFQKNETESELIQALMELPIDKRNLYIMYLEEGSILRLAKKLRVSAQITRRAIAEIKDMIKDRYEALNINILE